ncbi:hypothetical protein F8388_019629 [Cannabis sativa]|uniref:FAS1 domain-containing protein n=1 Tax=Cannabis sativa TaxID=3483 RepID=A0A7J6DVV7_CANSA|nr:hypothetical protein F8388_019629 [Cannabis sativa]
MAMEADLPISHFTPTPSILFLLFLLSSAIATAPTAALNITNLLSSFPDFSDFASLLSSSSSSLTTDLSRRSSITLLAVPNTYLSASSDLTRRLSSSSRADVVRYHILLEYLSPSDLRRISSSGKLVTTLLQTTGRATNNFGSVNITRDPITGIVSVRSPAPYSPSNATILNPIKTLPYNVSVFAVNSLLVPYGFDLMASETRPPLGLNITKALIDGHNFNVAASMLAASGVVEEFEADEGIVQVSVTQTVFDQNPVAIFGVSGVLLPKEIFGKNPITTTTPKPGTPFASGTAQPPDIAFSPEFTPGLDGPPSHLSSPPGLGQDIRSKAEAAAAINGFHFYTLILALLCIALSL